MSRDDLATASLSRALLAGSALGLVLAMGALPAGAQTSSDTMNLPAVSVESTGMRTGTAGSYKPPEVSSNPKFTEPLRDVPQSITVIPRQLIDDRNDLTLRDTLRNVPSVSIAAGEAGNQGDNLTLRGFNARNDIFLDSMRDYGSYTRDPFNLESVEVLKGPASVIFGRGSTGGVINQVSKQPQGTNFYAGSATLGTDATKRGTVDINQSVNELGMAGTAFRLNMFVQQNDFEGRDGPEYNRFGFAPTMTFGLGTATRITASYLHQEQDDTVDYGLPRYFDRVAPVSRSNFYGFKNDDYLRTDVDIGTVWVEHDFTDGITLRNQFRYGDYNRHIRVTEPQIAATTPLTTPFSNIAVTRQRIAADGKETFLQNQTDLSAKFNTGFLGHNVVLGMEVGRETSDVTRLAYTGVPTTNLITPNTSQAFTFTGVSQSQDVTTTARTFALYGMDTVKIGEQFEIIGGIRYDNFDVDYEQRVAPAVATSRVDSPVSYRTALVYKPFTIGSVYFGYGTSFNPSAETLTLAINNAGLAPEKTETYEIGTKWDLLDNKLSVRGAIYKSNKTNARTPDPNNTLFNVLSGEQEVEGFEMEVAGKITDEWQIYAGYSHLSSEIVKSNTVGEKGNRITNVPDDTFNLFTTYDLPWRIRIGGGVNYVSDRNLAQVPNAVTGRVPNVPGYWTANLLAKYALTDQIDLQVNVYNLLDKYYYDQLHPNHIVPGEGRTALFSTSFKF